MKQKALIFISFLFFVNIIFANTINAIESEKKTESLIKVESSFSVTETADRFEKILKKKGLTLFARIDHTKNAAGVDLKLRPTQVIIFGNPKVGTPLMQCEQTIAIDLPQKVLIYKDACGGVWLSYNNPDYLKERHQVEGCDQVFDKIKNVLGALSKAATS